MYVFNLLQDTATSWHAVTGATRLSYYMIHIVSFHIILIWAIPKSFAW